MPAPVRAEIKRQIAGDFRCWLFSIGLPGINSVSICRAVANFQDEAERKRKRAEEDEKRAADDRIRMIAEAEVTRRLDADAA
jgi:hypothetical protein